ncbi:MAG: trigger factor [Spirochaetales bacterium]|nr:trigger factor [Spirochaetales bacterium]
MIKSKNLEKLDNSSVRLNVTVDKEFIQKEYDELLGEYSKNLRLDGFRRGKVPPSVLVRKFGDSLLAETAERVIRKSLDQVLKDAEKQPLVTSVPEVDSEAKLELGSDYPYTVTFDTFPEIELPEYKGLEYEELQVKISEEDLERELKALQEQNSVVTDKKDATVLNGDIVGIDYVELAEDDSEVDGTRREGFVFEVGSGYNLYKIDNELVGAKAGEERVLTKEYPEGFEFEELAGRKVRLKVKVNSVKEKQLPAIDDELAQDISDKYQTLEDLKQDIRSKLEAFAAQKIREHSISQLLEKILAGATIPLPKSMVEHEQEDQWRNFVSRAVPRAQDFSAAERLVLQELEKEGKSKDELVAGWREAAEKKLKLQLAVSEMVNREKIEVDDGELDKRIEQEAEGQKMSVEDTRQAMERSHYLPYLRADLRNEKLYDLLLESGVSKKGKKAKFLDLAQGNY